VAKDSPLRLARVLFILLGLLMLGAAWMWRLLPERRGTQLVMSDELTGVLTAGYSFAYVLKTEHGAALVDTGADPRGKELLAQLAEVGVKPEQVHTVLLTHGHVDHWAAAHLFPQARVLVGPGDGALIRGEYPQKSLVGRLTRSMKRPPQPAQLEELKGEETLDVDGTTLRVIYLPGHTPGSVAYLLGDVLFTGDALVHLHKGLSTSPFFFSEDDHQSRESLRELRGVDFVRMLDGHSGLTGVEKEQLLELVK
jgi:glyoxylase-like metal-dependent hydrolase (beta-lactamase superfamily II)